MQDNANSVLSLSVLVFLSKWELLKLFKGAVEEFVQKKFDLIQVLLTFILILQLLRCRNQVHNPVAVYILSFSLSPPNCLQLLSLKRASVPCSRSSFLQVEPGWRLFCPRSASKQRDPSVAEVHDGDETVRGHADAAGAVQLPARGPVGPELFHKHAGGGEHLPSHIVNTERYFNFCLKALPVFYYSWSLPQ